MTLQEMMDKYEDKWFRYIPLGEPDLLNPFNNKGYVVYTADTEDELRPSPEKVYTTLYAGLNAYSPIYCGGFAERHE